MNTSRVINSIYYQFKPFIPRSLQIWLRRLIVNRKRRTNSDIWPILESAAEPSAGWSGWPEQKTFALVLTHDVDTQRGHDKCYQLMDLEERYKFRSSFNFVPERYKISRLLLKDLIRRGFEVGIHGLKHDGKLYKSKKIFSERAIRINQYLKEWGALGFRSPAMHHNLEWLHALNIDYDASTFDTDPFEPQSDGVRTIFPFWVSGNNSQNGYLELPYTLPQDFTLFIILKEKNIDIWKKKLDWIADKGGMALLNVHPDYMNFSDKRCSFEEYPAKFYEDFLEHIRMKYGDQYWHALPREIACFWKDSYVNRET